MTEENNTPVSYKQDASLSDKWKFRFDFFEKNGTPPFWGSKEYAQKLKALSLGPRVKVMANFWALFFAFIYLGILGLWKKAILAFLLLIVVNIIVFFLPGAWGKGVGMAYGFFFAFRANTYYYQFKVKGKQDWSL